MTCVLVCGSKHKLRISAIISTRSLLTISHHEEQHSFVSETFLMYLFCISVKQYFFARNLVLHAFKALQLPKIVINRKLKVCGAEGGI